VGTHGETTGPAHRGYAAPPDPPTTAQLAASLGTTEEHVREMGQRYRRWATDPRLTITDEFYLIGYSGLWGEWGWTE